MGDVSSVLTLHYKLVRVVWGDLSLNVTLIAHDELFYLAVQLSLHLGFNILPHQTLTLTTCLTQMDIACNLLS